MNATEAAQKIIDYLRIENEVKPGNSASDIDEIAKIVQSVIDSQQDNGITCEFRDCQNDAEYEGWYRVIDFANQPTGLIQKMRVCKSCTQFLIGATEPHPQGRAGGGSG